MQKTSIQYKQKFDEYKKYVDFIENIGSGVLRILEFENWRKQAKEKIAQLKKNELTEDN